MDEKEKQVRDAFAVQAEWCEKLASPFTALFCRTFAERVNRSTQAGKAILEWPGNSDPLNDVLTLRVAGVFHALAKRGTHPKLAALYPPGQLPEGAQLWEAVSEVLEKEGPEILRWLQWAPQTNEVARSIALNAGLMVLAKETLLQLNLFEVGSSAGLNLFPDRFHYIYDGESYGDSTSDLTLTTSWKGSRPPQEKYEVSARQGVDLNPLDVASEQDQERLRSYIWPDQPERQERVAAAIAIAEKTPPKLDRMDAADWVEEKLLGIEGQVSVLIHSIAFQYFPGASQDRIIRHMEKTGAVAAPSAPLAWLRYEIDPEYDNRATLRLRLWPEGQELVLAVGDPHCRSIEWLG
jgi:hypothetical protein